MNILHNFVLSMSGALVVGSILIAKIGFSKFILSRMNAAILAGTGAGIGVGTFVFYGVSKGDLIGSIITGIIMAFVVGFSIVIPSRWWQR
jgi:hypothetical protein